MKCYMDCFLSRPIYAYPSTISLMYFYPRVLLSRNYFYYHKSEMQWKKVWLKVNLPKIVTHLATRCLYQGVYLTKGHPAQSSTTLGHEMPTTGGYIWPKVSLPKVVSNLAMRYLFQGVHLAKGHPAWSSTKLCHEMSVLGGASAQRSFCPN